MKLAKKEILWIVLFGISTTLIGFVLFVGINPIVEITLENGEIIRSTIPISFSLAITLFLMFLSSVSSVSLVYYLDTMNKEKKQSLKNSLRANLLQGAEKRVFLFLLENNKDYIQKDLVYELGISKANLTRVLDSLEQKKILERVSFGNSNKVRLIK